MRFDGWKVMLRRSTNQRTRKCRGAEVWENCLQQRQNGHRHVAKTLKLRVRSQCYRRRRWSKDKKPKNKLEKGER